MDPQELETHRSGRTPNYDALGQHRNGTPAIHHRTISMTALSSAPSESCLLDTRSEANGATDGGDQAPLPTTPASSDVVDQPRKVAPSSLTQTSTQPHQQRDDKVSRVTKRTSPKEKTFLKPVSSKASFAWVQRKTGDTAYADVVTLHDSGAGDEVKSTALLLDAACSPDGEELTTKTKTQTTAKVEPAEPSGKRTGDHLRVKANDMEESEGRVLVAGSTKGPSSSGLLAQRDRLAKSPVTSSSSAITSAQPTVKTAPEHRTTLFHSFSSRLSTLWANVWKAVPKEIPRLTSDVPDAGTTEGQPEERKHWRTSALPKKKKWTLGGVRYCAETIKAEECELQVRQREQQATEDMTEGGGAVRNPKPLDTGPVTSPGDLTRKGSPTALSFPEGHGDTRRSRRPRNRLRLDGAQEGKTLARQCYMVGVMAAAGESPKTPDPEKEGKLDKMNRDRKRRPDFAGEAEAEKPAASGKRKHKKKRHHHLDKPDGHRNKESIKGEETGKETKFAENRGPPAELTYDVSAGPQREFNFSIATTPYTRGALPRPELTRPIGSQPGPYTLQAKRKPVPSRGQENLETLPFQPRHTPRRSEPKSKDQEQRASATTSPLSMSPQRSASPAHRGGAVPLVTGEAKSPKTRLPDTEAVGQPSAKKESSPPAEAKDSFSPGGSPRQHKSGSKRTSKSTRRHRSSHKSKSESRSEHRHRRKKKSHRGHDKSSSGHHRRHGTHGRRKKYAPPDAQESTGSGPHVFRWGTKDIPSVSGTYHELSWSTTRLQSSALSRSDVSEPIKRWGHKIPFSSFNRPPHIQHGKMPSVKGGLQADSSTLIPSGGSSSDLSRHYRDMEMTGRPSSKDEERRSSPTSRRSKGSEHDRHGHHRSKHRHHHRSHRSGREPESRKSRRSGSHRSRRSHHRSRRGRRRHERRKRHRHHRHHRSRRRRGDDRSSRSPQSPHGVASPTSPSGTMVPGGPRSILSPRSVASPTNLSGIMSPGSPQSLHSPRGFASPTSPSGVMSPATPSSTLSPSSLASPSGLTSPPTSTVSATAESTLERRGERSRRSTRSRRDRRDEKRRARRRKAKSSRRHHGHSRRSRRHRSKRHKSRSRYEGESRSPRTSETLSGSRKSRKSGSKRKSSRSKSRRSHRSRRSRRSKRSHRRSESQRRRHSEKSPEYAESPDTRSFNEIILGSLSPGRQLETRSSKRSKSRRRDRESRKRRARRRRSRHKRKSRSKRSRSSRSGHRRERTYEIVETSSTHLSESPDKIRSETGSPIISTESVSREKQWETMHGREPSREHERRSKKSSRSRRRSKSRRSRHSRDKRSKRSRRRRKRRHRRKRSRESRRRRRSRRSGSRRSTSRRSSRRKRRSPRRRRHRRDSRRRRRRRILLSPMRSRSPTASVLIVRKSDEQFSEDFAGQSTTPLFWFLLLTTLCATLVVILCVFAIYYALIIRPRPIPPVQTVPLPTFTDYTFTRPPHEESTPEDTTASFTQDTTPRPISTPKLDPYYCTSDYCNQEAAYISRVLSHDIHPCEDFYDHVCTTWTNEHHAHSSSTGSLISRDTMLQEALTRHLLEQLSGHDEKDVAMAAELHATCVNWITLYPPAASNLRILFAQWTILEWPRNDPVPESVAAVWRFAAELVRDLDLPTIAQVSVGPSLENLDGTALELDVPRFLLEEVRESVADVAELFKQAVTEIVNEMGASVPNDFEDRLFTVCSGFRAHRRSIYGDDHSSVAVRYGDLNDGLREFLKVLLSNVPQQPASHTSVVLRSAPYFTGHLDLFLQSVPPEDILNYLGFLVTVRLAPFLPRNLHGLQNLFVDSVMGRTIGDSEDRSLLCGWLVNQALPECMAKVVSQWRHSTGQDVATREWLSQLEALFLRHITDFRWINELSAILVRYRLKRQTATQLGLASGKQRLCAVELERSNHNPFLFYWNLSRHRQEKVLRGLLRNSGALRRWYSAGSELSTEASFRRAFQMVHVPAALLNDSVPAKGSVFVFHLARVAVRFYRAFVQLLYENPYERDAPVSFNEDTRAHLADLLACFRRIGHVVDPAAASSLGRTLLDHTSAVLLSVYAFDEFLPIRRIWKLDLRLNDLPDVTAHQLFFIYFALDNCESVDPAFHEARLSAKDRVNVPLRQLRQFAEAFSCGAGSPMVAVGQDSCQLLHPGRRRRSGLEASRRWAAEQESVRHSDATASPWTEYRLPPD